MNFFLNKKVILTESLCFSLTKLLPDCTVLKKRRKPPVNIVPMSKSHFTYLSFHGVVIYSKVLLLFLEISGEK